MSEDGIRRVESDADVDAYVRLANRSYGGTLDETRGFVDYAGAANLRLVGRGPELLSGLALYRMGQWFGGRSVPMWGVAAVAVDPALRGRGVGTRMMCDLVREMRAEGVALSSLFPAVQPLYRRAGWERAGTTHLVRLRLDRVAPLDRALPVRRATEADEPLLERLESMRAAACDGNLDRCAAMRRRARAPRGNTTEAYVVEEDGVPTGFVRLRNMRSEGPNALHVTDVVALTPGAAVRLATLLADQAAQVEDARWTSHPTDPLLAAVHSPDHDVKLGTVWMTRIVHLEAALTARGYAPGVGGEVQLHVEDDVCPENAGAWTLSVEGGAAAVRRGGAGRVRLHVRELATIYTGHVPPHLLARRRPIDGSDAELRLLGALFAGGDPWMQDGF